MSVIDNKWIFFGQEKGNHSFANPTFLSYYCFWSDGVSSRTSCFFPPSLSPLYFPLRLLMLALRRLRCLLHPVPIPQTRHLRTQPRSKPLYARRWDPTRNIPLRLTKAPSEPSEPRQDTPEHGLPKPTTDESHGFTDGQSSTQDIVIPVTSANPKKTRTLKRLQHLLNCLNCVNVDDSTQRKLRQPLWTTYKSAVMSKRTVLRRLPRRAWELLWKSEYTRFSDLPRRKLHLATLDRHRLLGEASPIPGQVAYHIEQNFMAGKEQQALDEWEINRHVFATMPECLDVGARLYALSGHPDQARAIMDHILHLDANWDPSLMIAVFRAHTSSDMEQHHQTAKELYESIKARSGPSITIQTYDSCLVGFLEARSLPAARKVFRDMVRDGCIGTEGHVGAIIQVIRRLNLLYKLGTDISGMTSIAIDAITVLPQAYHGYIFGDWIKSAVVEKAPHAAAQIFDMIIHRGYEPETLHCNLLIRALLRAEDSPNVLKAENLGWKMIEEARLSMLRDRPTARMGIGAIEKRLKDDSVLDAKPTMTVPAANVETFALIMDHHAQNLQWEHVDYLARQLKLANVRPDVSIMNVLMDNKCRQGKFTEMWQIYKSLTHDLDTSASVFPNGASIRCLWKTLRIALADPTAKGQPGLPTPRELLRETIEWWMLCRRRPDADRFLQGLAAEDHGAITILILHCFSYTQDLAGSLIALHVLRNKFGIRPTEKVALALQQHIAWVDIHAETESVRRQYGPRRAHAKKTQWAVHMYNQIAQRRFQSLNVTPELAQSYSKENIGDLELDTVSEFIRTAMVIQYPPEIVEMMIDAARKVVGVPRLPTGDMTAFDLE